jgi:hypothetical protein
MALHLYVYLRLVKSREDWEGRARTCQSGLRSVVTRIHTSTLNSTHACPVSLAYPCVPFCAGNIAHGAKVGANHTGRVADQEALIGEGVFFGLGSSVKFPVDLTHSAYTLVAAGTALDPQRCVWGPSPCGAAGGRANCARP